MPSNFPDKRKKPLGGGINPRAALNRGGKKYNLAKATSFVSGGRRMGEGVTASGKNNIVGFKRGGVRGSRKGLDALVRAISTNIVNNTENTQNNVTNFAGKEREKTRKQLTPSVQRQTKNVTRVVKPQVSNLNKTVNNVRNQSFNNIRTFRDSRNEGKESGTGLFGGLFGRIRNGLDLIKLLTNKQTQKELSKSIKNLEFFFNDAYRVAFRLRKNLVKIFQALRKIKGGAGRSGIPGIPRIPGRTRSPNIPGMGIFGGRSKRRPKRRRGRGRAGLLLGLGGGALGMGLATNALAGEGPQIKAAETAQIIPEGFIDRFQSIVDKFSSVIDGFLNKKPKPAPGGGSGAAGADAAAAKALPRFPSWSGRMRLRGRICARSPTRQSVRPSWRRTQWLLPSTSASRKSMTRCSTRRTGRRRRRQRDQPMTVRRQRSVGETTRPQLPIIGSERRCGKQRWKQSTSRCDSSQSARTPSDASLLSTGPTTCGSTTHATSPCCALSCSGPPNAHQTVRRRGGSLFAE